VQTSSKKEPIHYPLLHNEPANRSSMLEKGTMIAAVTWKTGQKRRQSQKVRFSLERKNRSPWYMGRLVSEASRGMINLEREKAMGRTRVKLEP